MLNSSVNEPGVVVEVTAAHDRYEAALMANDLATLDGLFWSSADTLRFGANDASYGIDAIREFRRTRRTTELARTVSHFTVVTFGDDSGITTIEFERDVSGVTRHGRQTQVWRRFADQGWKIVSAHVSLLDEVSGVVRAGRLIGLKIPAAHWAGVHQQLTRSAAFAQLLTGFPLPDDVEAAPVFRP